MSWDFTPTTPCSNASRNAPSSSQKALMLLPANAVTQDRHPQPRRHSYSPMLSSPLASSSSPSHELHENVPPDPTSPLARKHPRFGQYKASGFARRSLGGGPRLLRPGSSTTRSPIFQHDQTPSSAVAHVLSSPLDQSAQSLLRSKFIVQADRSAQNFRFKMIQKRRGRKLNSQDPFLDDDMGDEDEENSVDGLANDELFTRLLDYSQHKQRHQYNLSYEYDVGSSFDPNMEDPAVWEEELTAQPQDDLPEDEDDLEAYIADNAPPVSPPPKHEWTEEEWESMFDDIPDEVFLTNAESQNSVVSSGSLASSAFDSSQDVDMDM
ncbi:hypothetical protein DL96DRAFT_1581561 [Flagelloscypha sp. PMI_526]|nr:hypothetical protein DL96DRAFT_1581561 [Flagelloscypha sp. PMI_526]